MVTTLSAMQPFRLDIPASPAWRQPARAAADALEHVFQLDRLNQLYGEFRAQDDGRSFSERVLEFLNVKTGLLAEELAALPRTGPVVVVANHPFGGIEGMVLAKIFQSVRPDMRVLANSLLARIPECREFMFFVNPFGGQAAARENIGALKQAIRWVQQGGLLVTFPAGEVARFDLRAGRIEEAPWNTNIARIIRKTRASVVPVFIAGENGPLFHAAGLVHPRLRTALLPQEFLNKRNTTIRVRLGKTVAFEKLARFSGDAQMIQYLRVKTETLAHRGARFQALKKPAPAASLAWKKSPVPVAAPAAVSGLRRDIAALDASCTLLQQDQFRVLCARAQQLPAVLPEIGRLRELTFRAVGEGTGRARDLDRFDVFYLHLFIWNEEAGEIVGAYRLGPTDEIVPRYGLRGLYTNTLFKFRQPLVKHLTPALELGRSFVRPEYQREYLPLLLLWRGVCQYVSRHPQYRHLFGPVSISNDYRSISRHLIAQHFPRASQTPDLARWVRPRRPLRTGLGAAGLRVPAELAGDLQTLAELVEDLENGRGLPVLLRQYLKLGGEVLAFNVDPAFNDALDALIVVDLLRADPAQIGRYMGAENLKRYGAFHAEAPAGGGVLSPTTHGALTGSSPSHATLTPCCAACPHEAELRSRQVTPTNRSSGMKQQAKWTLALLAAVGFQTARGEWYDDGKIKGDMRYRFENIQQEGAANRNRERVRARLGYFPRINNDVDVGIQLATSEAVNGLGDPISNNQTLGSAETKKGIYLDLAYFDWHPSILPGLDLIGGKMKNPLIVVNDYLWDNDLTPEGLALKYKVGDEVQFLVNGTYQWIQERSADDDTRLYAGQVALNFQPNADSHIMIGATYDGFQKMKGFGVQDWQNSNKAYGNSTTKKVSGTTTNSLYATDFKVMEGFVEAGTAVAGLPVTVFGAYAKNADPDSNNKGYTAGLKLGKASDPNTFELGYDYRHLDKDVFPGFLVDSDANGGGTDGKGHKISLTYAILKNWQAKISYFLDTQKIAAGETENDYKRLQIDLVAKF